MESLVEGQNVAGEDMLAKDKNQESGRDPEKVEWGGSHSFKNHHIQLHPGDGLQLSVHLGQATSEPEPT